MYKSLSCTWGCCPLVVPMGIFFFLEPNVDVPMLGIQSELQLLAYAAATATLDLKCIFDLQSSSQQRWSLNHWRRPGIKPTYLWMLVRFTTAELQWELPMGNFLHSLGRWGGQTEKKKKKKDCWGAVKGESRWRCYLRQQWLWEQTLFLSSWWWEHILSCTREKDTYLLYNLIIKHYLFN